MKYANKYKGDYNYLLNTQCAYGIELLVNPEPTEDKVFNTVEFRSIVGKEEVNCLTIRLISQMLRQSISGGTSSRV